MFATYTLLYTLGLCLLAPRAALHRILGGRYAVALEERLGRVPERLAQYRGCIWIHAVSVGEVHAARGLIPHLRRLAPGTPILLSTTTPTGQEIARHADADATFYMPLDIPAVVDRYLRVLVPRALLLVETEIWPNLLRACGTRGVRTALVNARLSASSCRRYARLQRVWAAPFDLIDVVCTRTDVEAKRFHTLGIAAADIFVTGNLKADAEALRPSVELHAKLEELLGTNTERPLIVAGCTMDNEEQKVLRAFRRVQQRYPQARLLIAPRHPERFNEVEALIQHAGFTCGRRTRPATIDSEVILLDTIGELPAAYGLGDVAFVGGSLVRTGGHNMLEPAIQGRALLFGPSTENFAALAAELLRAGGAYRIADPDALGERIVELIANPRRRHQMGQHARTVALRDASAGRRTARVLLRCLPELRA